MSKILLITGPAGAVQGWGNLETTIRIRRVLNESGQEAAILYASSLGELINGLESCPCDLVWSSLYHLSSNCSYVGVGADSVWLADIFDQWEVPYIGSNAQTMKNLIDKAVTLRILDQKNIPVPKHYIVPVGEQLSINSYPWFVKPCFESESTGISEASVVHSNEELQGRLSYIHASFQQAAIVEEYLPGREFTVTVLGNGNSRKILPVLNVIARAAFHQYPLVTLEAKLNNLISFRIPEEKAAEVIALAGQAAEALDCLDHVRVDMREDQHGRLHVLEVNGIPGLHPMKSRSLHTHEIYYPEYSKEENFQKLINTIVHAAASRYGSRHITKQCSKKQETNKVINGMAQISAKGYSVN